MPNHVVNHLIIVGDSPLEDVVTRMKQVGGDNHFDFAAIISPPGASEFTKEWMIDNWGSPSNSMSTSLVQEDRRLVYMFATEDDAPYSVILTLSKEFPNLSFLHEYINNHETMWGIDIYSEGMCKSCRFMLDDDKSDLSYNLLNSGKSYN